MAGFNENAADEMVGHRLALLRYEAGTTEALLKAYERALRDVDRAFVELSARIRAGESVDTRQRERLLILGTDLDRKIRELRKILEKSLLERLEEAADAEAAFQRRTLTRYLGSTFHAAPEAAVATALRAPIGGGVWTDRLAVDLLEARDGLQQVLALAAAKGSSIPHIAAALHRGGQLQETYRGRLVSIARTEMQRVSNTVAMATYAENLDVVGGVQYLATLDSRTCLVCAPYHNQVFRYDAEGHLAGIPTIPQHPRCRCFAAPVTRSWEDIGVRTRGRLKGAAADFDETPAADTTFDAWLRRRGAVVQTEILGAGRRDLWLAGTPLGAFSDGRRVLRLGELRGVE